jgi:hypothetical protein
MSGPETLSTQQTHEGFVARPLRERFSEYEEFRQAGYQAAG